MKRSGLFLVVGAVVWVLAWFLPVCKEGSTLADGILPGWEAFRVALSPAWDYSPHISYQAHFLNKVLSIVSGFSNFVFLAAFLLARHKKFVPAIWKLLLVCAVINLITWCDFGLSDAGLKIGYYLWMGSFFLLAAGFFLKAREA